MQINRTFSCWPLWLIIALAFYLQACAVSKNMDVKDVEIERTLTEIAPEALLDVGLVLFDPGIPEDEAEQQKELIFPDVRRAEARYIPFHLKRTLENTGYWGSVWVLPEASEAVDLLVWGRIEQSNGLEVTLHIAAWDATGHEWLNKKFSSVVPGKAYSSYRDAGQDPYQNVYNEIANELLALRDKLSRAQLVEIRQIAQLRYAADLVPAAYSDYLQKEKDGSYVLRRLPADNDPMTQRLSAVREREYLLADTLNEYYAGLYYDLSKPYEDWRKMSREESLRYAELKRSARMRQLLGLAAIVGAFAYEGSGGSNGAITNVAILGGFESLRSGFQLSGDAEQYQDSLRELGKSFDSEAEVLVIEVEGQTRRLTGSAEQKYQEWRRILKEIYSSETGGVLDAAVIPTDESAGNASGSVLQN